MFQTLSHCACITLATLALAGCVTQTDVSRDLPLDTAPAFEAIAPSWSVAALQVTAPRTLTVSETNSIRPAEDIVWREDPAGDRYRQIEDLVDGALAPVLPQTGDVPVVLHIEIARFHSLTDRARYSIGGTHEIQFTVEARHAETGAMVSGPRAVDLSFPAFGGQQALDAEDNGITQRSRITERLQDWARANYLALPAFES